MKFQQYYGPIFGASICLGHSVFQTLALVPSMFYLFEPAHEIMVLITQATSEGSDKPAQSRQSLHCSHMKYGSRRRVRPKIRHLALLDGCACMFDE